jgi:hypothetical protein
MATTESRLTHRERFFFIGDQTIGGAS